MILLFLDIAILELWSVVIQWIMAFSVRGSSQILKYVVGYYIRVHGSVYVKYHSPRAHHNNSRVSNDNAYKLSKSLHMNCISHKLALDDPSLLQYYLLASPWTLGRRSVATLKGFDMTLSCGKSVQPALVPIEEYTYHFSLSGMLKLFRSRISLQR